MPTEPVPALAGMTVLDLATFLAAPVCATLLGEFGADVIKVEQPARWSAGAIEVRRSAKSWPVAGHAIASARRPASILLDR